MIIPKRVTYFCLYERERTIDRINISRQFLTWSVSPAVTTTPNIPSLQVAPTGPKIPSFLSPCPAYKGILPLRLLQLEPHLASVTSGLMDHSEAKDMEGAGEDEVVRLFKEDWGCSFTEEEIIRADGILDA